MVIEGKNGVYIVEEGKISLLSETKNFKEKRPVNHKLIKKIKELLEHAKKQQPQ